MSIRTLFLVGVSTFILGVLMQPLIFPKPPQIRTFVPEGGADKVQNPSEKMRIPEIQPLPQFVPPSEHAQVDPNTLQDLQSINCLYQCKVCKLEMFAIHLVRCAAITLMKRLISLLQEIHR